MDNNIGKQQRDALKVKRRERKCSVPIIQSAKSFTGTKCRHTQTVL